MKNISELKKLCDKYRLSPSKQYGQNFLLSDKPIREMIETADIKKTDTVVEIGPGFGVLTFELAKRVERVLSFEIEKKLEDYWAPFDKLRAGEDQGGYNNIEVVWGNFLSEAGKYLNGLGEYKVVANLPYQITSRLFRTLFELENKPKKIVVMVQKEVAERIVATPPNISLLAISIQYFGVPKIISTVKKDQYWPEPRVDSAILHIDEIENKTDYKEFFKLVKAGFSSPRKQVWKNISVGLGLEGDLVKEILKEVMGNEKVRAQEMGVEEWEGVLRILKRDMWRT